jgi:hypothetical protein
MTNTMSPPIGPVIAASAAVHAELGMDPTRFWSFGEAPRDADGNVQSPYAVWQTVYGSPQNFIDGESNDEQWGLQIDVYARTADDARRIAGVLRAVLKPHTVLVAFNGESKDVPTGLYRYSFTIEWITD